MRMSGRSTVIRDENRGQFGFGDVGHELRGRDWQPALQRLIDTRASREVPGVLLVLVSDLEMRVRPEGEVDRVDEEDPASDVEHIFQ